MDEKSVKFIAYAISMCLAYVIINYLSNRGETQTEYSQSDIEYVVRMPSALKYVYLVMFLFGLLLFVVFFISKLHGNPTATDGHIRLALIVASIGFLVMVMAVKWKIKVNGSDLEIYRLFRGTENIYISEIDSVEIGKKNQITLYYNKKKLVTVDSLCDNYDRFIGDLRRYGKL